ncbi:MAG TPA: NADH-quinone oxidoreductase subunit B family protein [Dehalococcoidia bacterium]|nr:NADH-quinone oxidoreductase subunit B family protein [Dehalococcoidia bacterium]
MEVDKGNTPGENAPDVTPPTPDAAPNVTPEAAAASEAADVPRTTNREVPASSEGAPAESPAEAIPSPAAVASAQDAAATQEGAVPGAAAPAAATPPTQRPARSTSEIPGRVPEPNVEEVPVMSRPMSLGVQLEMARLTPVEPENAKALYRTVLPGVMQVPADYIIAAARKSSLWPMTFGLACCAIEMIATYMSHHDLDRFGIVPWPSPRQCDVMIVAGTVTKKMAPAVKLLYQQMPNPKWVISMGACATNGGPYTRYDRVLQGVDKIIPVDVYVPGCPPRPEALIDGFIALQNKIMEERNRVG